MDRVIDGFPYDQVYDIFTEEKMKREKLPNYPRVAPLELQACLDRAETSAQVIDCMYRSLAQFGMFNNIGENYPGLWQKIQEWRKVGV